MPTARCDGETCCQRWRELYAAYAEGRQEEVAREVARILREEGKPACRSAPRLLTVLALDGWELP